jgi:Copper amine oxidase N-terminal domain
MGYKKRSESMKKLISIFLVLLMFISLLGTSGSASAAGGKIYVKNNVSILLNGKKLSISEPVINQSGHILLPMRAVYESVGASISWNQKEKTVKANRNGKEMILNINSSAAYVNGVKNTLTTPPLLYKNRTYVPLRFVIENFDGKVIWNQKKQTVELSVGEAANPEPEQPSDPFTLYLNNRRIVMDKPAILKGGRNYIPAKYFYENLENSTGEWLDQQSMEMVIGGLSFTFTPGSRSVLVNQEPALIDEVPFMANDELYVPVHYVVNALGGNLRFRSESKEIYIYINQFMFTSEFLPKEYGPTIRPEYTPSASLEGSRDLLLSDNPETITSAHTSSAAVLSENIVSAQEASRDHRVFGWHYNRIGKDMKLGITIENRSQSKTLQIASSKGITKRSNNSWINYDIGLPIADAVLNDRLVNKLPANTVINPGETVVLEEFDFSRQFIIGFLNDLTITSSGQGSSDYVIRTVLAETNQNLADIKGNPLPVDRDAAHPRGVWPQTSVKTELPAYTAGTAEVGYNLSNGRTDHLLTEDNSLSKTNGSVGNPGHFGLTYKVHIPLVNPDGSSKKIRVKASGRGGLYSGAIKINGEVHLIPTLRPGTEYVNIMDYDLQGTTDTLEIEIMHAGGAALPVAIYLETL